MFGPTSFKDMSMLVRHFRRTKGGIQSTTHGMNYITNEIAGIVQINHKLLQFTA